MPVKKLPANNIFPNKQEFIITDSIDPKRISKSPTSCLNASSAVKAVLVFAGTIGLYNLFKNRSIFSYLGLRKNPNLKNVGNKEIVSAKESLSVKMNLKTIGQANSPSVNRIVRMHENEDRRVEFKEKKIEEFENLPEVKKENVEKRRSISLQNPIPNQNVIVGKSFNLTIDGNHVFSSSSALSLEAKNAPTWLTSSLNPTFKG